MTDDCEQHPVDALAEEFALQIRNGQNPAIEDYVRRHPEHATIIRAVFPSIALVERVSSDEDRPLSSTCNSVPWTTARQTPQLLGDFEILGEIGRGGMGVVYEAVQQSLKRHVALKVMNSLTAGTEKQLKRFRREAESAAALHHSNIVQVYGIGEDQGLQYYAMQLIDGVTLAEIVQFLKQGTSRVTATVHGTLTETGAADAGDLSSNSAAESANRFQTTDAVQLLLGPPLCPVPASCPVSRPSWLWPVFRPSWLWPVSRPSHYHPSSPPAAIDNTICSSTYCRNVARIMAHVASAVQYAHHQHILHRDLKPANLILDRDGTIWVADFGLARSMDIEDLTQTGEIVGTLRYMAPEQLTGLSEPRSDIYALGVTLYELLTLQPAVDAPHLLSGPANRRQIPNPRSINWSIPADLETITLRACATEPNQRYQSAAELESDLRRFLEDRPILARRVTPIEKLYRWTRRNPGIASLSSATVLLLLIVASLLAIGNHQKQNALEAVSSEFLRAERNLHEKTAALIDVERERQRAETNLNLAVSAFEEVFNNIAARGRSDSLLIEMGEGEDYLSSADAVLSNADVTLLETLLGFFDQLALENTTDLSTQSAEARARVGNIQQQLGRLNDAQNSYQQALNAYQVIAQRKPDDTTLILAQAGVLQQQMVTAAKKGERNQAVEYYDALKSLLTSSTSLSQSNDVRFALVSAMNSLVTLGLRYTPEPRFRPRYPMLNRLPADDDSAAAAPTVRLRREAETNAEALSLLRELLEIDPGNSSYRAALAQASRHQSLLALWHRDGKSADEALDSAIAILESLLHDFPESDRFQYELAETLSTTFSYRPRDIQRLAKSQKLCRELISVRPDVPEYRALYAATLTRLSAMQFMQGRKDRAEQTLNESLKHYQQLADQFPDVLLYQMGLVRSLQQLAQIHVDRKQPEKAREHYDHAISRLERMSVGSRFRPLVQPLLTRLREGRSRLE